MNLFGIGGLELMVVFLVALLVVGPVRLVHGARMARKYMTELRRQREELTQMVEEAVDIEDIRERLDQEGVLDDVRDLKEHLEGFREDAESLTVDAADFKSMARSVVRPSGYSRSQTRPAAPVEDDAETREEAASSTETPSKESES